MFQRDSVYFPTAFRLDMLAASGEYKVAKIAHRNSGCCKLFKVSCNIPQVGVCVP